MLLGERKTSEIQLNIEGRRPLSSAYAPQNVQALTVSNSKTSLLKGSVKQHLLADVKKLAPSGRSDRILQRNGHRFSSAKPSDATQDTLN